MPIFQLKCSHCLDIPAEVRTRALIDEARKIACQICGRRMTVIGHEEQPLPEVKLAPTYEHIGLSKAARAHVDSVSRTLVLSALEREEKT